MLNNRAYELISVPKLVIADGAGTVFDPGSKIPFQSFETSFNENGFDIDRGLIEKYMGKSKREHIFNIINDNDFIEMNGLILNKSIVDKIYSDFLENLYSNAKNTKEISGVKDSLNRLRDIKIPLILTSGYDRKMIELTRRKFNWLDELVFGYVTNSELIKGRPDPEIIYRSIELSGISKFSEFINVGDTKVDVESSDNAFIPGVLVTSGCINNYELAEKVNLELGREHLILPSLVELIDYILDGTIVDRIRTINN